MAIEGFVPLDSIAEQKHLRYAVIATPGNIARLLMRPNIDIAAIAEGTSWGVRSLNKIPGVDARASKASKIFTLGDGAEVITGLTILGMKHVSQSKIDEFTSEKAAGISGKFGSGTYFGVGDLKGETVDTLNRPGNIIHSASLEGSFLFIDRPGIAGVARQLRGGLGLPESKVKSSIKNAPITDMISQYGIDEGPIDAVVMFMDPERMSAEVVVAPHATDLIVVNDTTSI